MLQQLFLSPPHLPAGYADHCQGGSCCGCSSSNCGNCCDDPTTETLLQQSCCLTAAAGEWACSRCIAYAQLLRLRCDSSPAFLASPPNAAVAFQHMAPPKSDELERAAAATATAATHTSPSEVHRSGAAEAETPSTCCCCCFYYGSCGTANSSSSNSCEVWGPLPVSVADDFSCDFGGACDSCLALQEAPSPLDADDGDVSQLWGPEEESWGHREYWGAPSRCPDAGGPPEHERRAAAVGVGALLLQLPSNLICDATLLTSVPSPLNAGERPLGPLPPCRNEAVPPESARVECCQRRCSEAYTSRSSTSTCCCALDFDVARQNREGKMEELLPLEKDLLLHDDQAPEAGKTPSRDINQQQQQQQQQIEPSTLEQLSPSPVSYCASGCASPLQHTHPDQRSHPVPKESERQQQQVKLVETRETSSQETECQKPGAGTQQMQQSPAAATRQRVRRRRASDPLEVPRLEQDQQEQEKQPYSAGSCCCGNQQCVCTQQQRSGSFFATGSDVSTGQPCYGRQEQQQQESFLLPVQKRKRLTDSTLADSSCDEWVVGQQDQWPCDGQGCQALLLSAEEQQQQLSPASFYNISCSPSTATTGAQQQLQHGDSTAANCGSCGSAASCCCCSSLGLEPQQQQHAGLHTIVEGTLTRQLSHVSQESGGAADTAASSGSQECNRDSSAPSTAPSPKVAAAAAPLVKGGPFVCNVEIPVCVPQFEDSTDCLSLLNLTEAQWQQFRAQGMFKLGDKGRAIIKSRISRQLRVFPHLRKKASSVAGVRCATTKQLFQLAQICGLYDVLPPQFQPASFRSSQQGQQQQSSQLDTQQRGQDAAAVAARYSSLSPLTSSSLTDAVPGSNTAAATPTALMVPDFEGASPGGSSSSSAVFWQQQQQQLLLESMQQQSQQQVFCEQQQLQLPLI
ncbi:AT hook motif-containing protein, putative [Eimeria tenella]|uniref:AT hook motif-containing protein, putative n=1 Tax=Eimeria tenella TaxID=5802 RepID=U6KQ83_EIMTE|nr:AT hook motif-containing protein, putative [Eimeria tenella]CDJ39073.1 AT hook motif-containing protein, putative [Eimeria tenella]|eukprot:XP_013229828.1 AT hook motif-containing protein, putative [Eimeria tenella]